jgi:hypothetical protein
MVTQRTARSRIAPRATRRPPLHTMASRACRRESPRGTRPVFRTTPTLDRPPHDPLRRRLVASPQGMQLPPAVPRTEGQTEPRLLDFPPALPDQFPTSTRAASVPPPNPSAATASQETPVATVSLESRAEPSPSVSNGAATSRTLNDDFPTRLPVDQDA